jgi:hypothetical protein
MLIKGEDIVLPWHKGMYVCLERHKLRLAQGKITVDFILLRPICRTEQKANVLVSSWLNNLGKDKTRQSER